MICNFQFLSWIKIFFQGKVQRVLLKFCIILDTIRYTNFRYSLYAISPEPQGHNQQNTSFTLGDCITVIERQTFICLVNVHVVIITPSLKRLFIYWLSCNHHYEAEYIFISKIIQRVKDVNLTFLLATLHYHNFGVPLISGY